MWATLRNIGDVAGRVFLHLLAIAILYPTLVIFTGFGWNAASWGWFFFHLGVAGLTVLGGIVVMQLQFPFLGLLVWLGAGFSLLGVFDFLKPLGMGIGLFGAGVADLILGLYAFLGVGAFGAVVALAPGEELTVQAAEARARAALRGFVAVAAWQWAAGLFMIFFGRDVSWHLFWFLLFSVSILAHAMVAWNTGGNWGRSMITWGAGGCFFITTFLVVMRMAEDTPAGWAILPFFQAAIPFGVLFVLWFFALGGRLIKGFITLVGVLMIARGVLINLPPTTGEALVGRSLYSVSHLGMPDPGFGGVERAIRQREAALLRAWLHNVEERAARAQTLQELERLKEDVRPYQQWWGRGKEGEAPHRAGRAWPGKEGGLNPPLSENLTRLMDEVEKRIRKMRNP